MALKKVSKLEIAKAQLDQAMRLFVEGEDMISVITLAGAAEEISGKLLAQAAPTKKNALRRRIEQTSRLHMHLWGNAPESEKFIADYQNKARNALKHFNDNEPGTIQIDPEVEAMRMIDRALENVYALQPRLARHIRSYRKKRSELVGRMSRVETPDGR